MRLRANDSAAEGEAIEIIYRYFNLAAHRANTTLNGLIYIDEGQDMANSFFEKNRWRTLVMRYRNLDAAAFSGVFYTSMKNFATDWVRERIRKAQLVQGLYAPDPDREEEPSSDNETPFSKGWLTPGERAEMLKDLKAAMLRNVDGDEAKAWILEAKIIQEFKSQEVARILPKLFPGKVYAVGSIDAIVSRFRNSPEAAAWRRKWFKGQAY